MVISPSWLSELRSKYKTLPPKVRITADYIIRHPEDAIHCSLQQLAGRIGVSQYTVLNCIRVIGFNSYSDFRMSMALEVQEFGSEQKEQPLCEEEDRQIWQDLSATFEGNARGLLDSTRMINPKDFALVIQRIFFSKRTSLYGIGWSSYVAQYLCIQLVRQGLHAVSVVDPAYQIMDAATLIENDLVFGFSTSGASPSIVEAFNIAKDRNCHTIAITASPDSPLARISDTVLVTTSSGPEHAVDNDNSVVEQISLASAISTAVYRELQHGKKRTI